MIETYIELAGEAPDLARAEAVAATAALGGRVTASRLDPLLSVELPDASAVRALSARLALARRCLVVVRPGAPSIEAIAAEGPAGGPAVFRRLGRSGGGVDPGVLSAGRAYRAAGGAIDLEHPRRRFWLAGSEGGPEVLLEEVATVDRRAAAGRRMPLLPFQRPVSLPPRLARAAANLARIRPGDRVLDPFLGTGALLAEAALLGAQVVGIDRDPEMVRGALRNFAHLGVAATRFVAGDAAEVDPETVGPEFDALLTDPPYGRSSSTGGADPAEVVARVLPRWTARVRPTGRLVVIAPAGTPPLDGPWTLETAVPVRVHRSLTREFRVYARGP